MRDGAPNLSCMETYSHRTVLGGRIRSLREAQGLSQRKLALMADTNQTHLWQVETGRANVGIDLLYRLASALGVRVQDLIDF